MQCFGSLPSLLEIIGSRSGLTSAGEAIFSPREAERTKGRGNVHLEYPVRCVAAD